MRKSIFTLMMMMITLILGVSMHCGAKAPPDIGPKIEKQYTTVQMVSPAVTTVDYCFQSVITDVFVTADTGLPIREDDIAIAYDNTHVPVSYDFDTGVQNANFIFYLAAPPLPFQYCEGRSTEYRCVGHS